MNPSKGVDRWSQHKAVLVLFLADLKADIGEPFLEGQNWFCWRFLHS